MATKPITISPLTGVLDLRSTPDSIPAGGVRMRQNLQTTAEGKLSRGCGWSKLLTQTNYNNADFHDQLLVFDGIVTPIPTPSLYWTLDAETAPGTFPDEIEEVEFGALPSNLTTGKINNGFHFVVGAGTAQLDAINKTELNHTLGQDMAFAFWLKVLTAADANDVCDIEYRNDVIDCDFSVEFRESMVFRGNDGVNDFGEAVPDSDVVLGEWNHWVVNYNATTGAMKLYQNGTLKHTGSVAVFLPTTVTDQSLRCQVRGSLGSNAMSAVIDEIAFWFGRQLSESEMASLYNFGAGRRPEGV